MEIRPASIDDVAIGRDGKRYVVTAEAGSIAKQLQEIDPRLFVEFHEPPPGREGNAYFSVACRHESGKVDLVMRVRWQDFDQRVVEHIRKLNHELRHGRTLVAEWEKAEEHRKREKDRALEELIGERAYPLMRAIQRDVVGQNPRASFYIPTRRAA